MSKMKCHSLRIEADLLVEMQTLTRDLAGSPKYLTITEFINEAIRRELKRWDSIVEKEGLITSKTMKEK